MRHIRRIWESFWNMLKIVEGMGKCHVGTYYWENIARVFEKNRVIVMENIRTRIEFGICAWTGCLNINKMGVSVILEHVSTPKAKQNKCIHIHLSILHTQSYTCTLCIYI